MQVSCTCSSGECWNEDVWKAIHILSLSSSLKENEEKVSFCTMLLSLNRIISCPNMEKELCFFIDQPDHDLTKYMSSNKLLFSWTQQLREQLSKVMNKKAPTLAELTAYYNPSMLSKDVWGPVVWKFIHTTMLKAKMENNFCTIATKKAIKAFVTCMAILIPCPKCRSHAWEYYTTHEIDRYLETNLVAFEWSTLFHNAVTERTNAEHGLRRRTYKAIEALPLYVDIPSDVSFESKFYHSKNEK
jgi:hypothetical protein